MPPTDSHSVQKPDDLIEPGEQVVTEVKRHPIGLIAMYIEAFVGLVTMIILAVILSPTLSGHLSKRVYNLIALAVTVILLLLAVILLIATYIYRQSKLIVTNQSLVQILQNSLFSKRISRLSMSNVEDVSAEHQGILPSLFDYGTITVQTAGEEDNFIFPYCPKPNHYAGLILQARQAYAAALHQSPPSG